MTKPGSVVVLTGPPGAGKTSVAKDLAMRRSHCVLVDGDSFFNDQPSTVDAVETAIHEQSALTGHGQTEWAGE